MGAMCVWLITVFSGSTTQNIVNVHGYLWMNNKQLHGHHCSINMSRWIFSLWGHTDLGKTAPPRTSQFLERVKNFPTSASFTCNPTNPKPIPNLLLYWPLEFQANSPLPDAEAETPILWPPDVKNWLTGKDPDVGERLKAGGEADDRGWDGWMPSPTRWTCVWARSRS